MINNERLLKALSKQINWLQTWKTKEGAYNGYVVHRYDLKRMFKIHDTPWSQGPIINGYLNLYKKTKDKRWLQEAIQAADMQCARLHKTGKYIYAGFEDDRFSSLVHNSLANCALLDLVKILIDENAEQEAQKYLNIVKKNIDSYIIKVLWDENFGAFKMSEIDYYSPNITRFIVNMNSVAVESLIKLLNLTGEEKYKYYVLRVGKWILTEQINSPDLENGGINYSQVQPRVLISIYTALAMRGLDDLYFLTNDYHYLNVMINAAEHLIRLVDPETKFFYHAIINGKLIKYPQFIAGAGIILKALDDAENLTKKRFDYDNVLDAILQKQLPNGGFSSFIGYRNINDKKIEVWEDVVPVVGWNAHIFEFLTRKVSDDFSYYYDHQKKQETSIYVKFNRNFCYLESKNLVLISGFRPFRNVTLFFCIKRMNTALFYLSTSQFKKFLYFISGMISKKLKNIKNIFNVFIRRI